jgi:NAD-dependent SIR2 family protein deacetylase
MQVDEQVVARAAAAVSVADFLLLVTGAGMGKDSGMSTFEDIKTQVDAYSSGGLSYEDFASPDALSSLDHDLIYGYWGNQFNTFSDTTPHEGYHILSRWCEGSALEKPAEVELAAVGENTNPVRRYFAWTTNIDSQFQRTTTTIGGNSFSFSPQQLVEQHGAMARWQCGQTPACSQQVWTAPKQFRFNLTTGSDGFIRAPAAAATFNGFGGGYSLFNNMPSMLGALTQSCSQQTIRGASLATTRPALTSFSLGTTM